MKNNNVHYLTELALLTAMITIMGAVKIPNIIPGIEFQLSAPLAVAICVVFGFKKYIICGCLSSLIGLLLGTQNILNVFIALQFRVLVGVFLYMGHNHVLAIIMSGPIASAISRFTLSFLVGKGAIAMIMAALPGMIFTAFAAPVFVKLLQKVNQRALSNQQVLSSTQG